MVPAASPAGKDPGLMASSSYPPHSNGSTRSGIASTSSSSDPLSSPLLQQQQQQQQQSRSHLSSAASSSTAKHPPTTSASAVAKNGGGVVVITKQQPQLEDVGIGADSPTTTTFSVLRPEEESSAARLVNSVRTTRPTRLRKLWAQALPYLQLWETRRDLLRVGWLFCYFIACMFFVALANSYADRIWNSPQKQLPAPDAILDGTEQWFEESGLPLETSDYIVNVAAALALLRIFTMGRRTAQVLRRTFFIIGSLFALRAVCIFATVLPNPWQKCRSQPDPNYVVDALKILLRIRYACGDVFFSGHTIFFTVTLLLYWQFPVGPRSHRYLSHLPAVVVTAYCLMGMLSLIVTTLHYTIDVLIAFVLVCMSWTLLWAVTEVPALKFGTGAGHFVGSVDDPFWEQNFEDWRRLQKYIDSMHLEEVVIDDGGGGAVKGDPDSPLMHPQQKQQPENIPMNDMSASATAAWSPPNLADTFDGPRGSNGRRIKGL